MPSQQQTSKTAPNERDEWRTPRFVFDYMDRIYHFDVDLAAAPENALVPFYYTRGENALEQSWSVNGRLRSGWLNPPYSDIDPWLRKARDEACKGFTTVVLTMAPNGQDRYGSLVFDVASEVTFITGRLAFLRPDGTPVTGNTHGSILIVYRAYDLYQTRYRHVLRDDMKKDLMGTAA